MAVVHYGYLNIYQNILYIMGIIITVRQFFRTKEMPTGLVQFIVFTAIGYGLFHLIWEARSRYILTAMILLLLYVCIYVEDRKNTEIA